MIDLDALKARLAEYDDYAPKCPKKVERKTNCAPDAVLSSDPTYHEYIITTYSPCCRPEGHEGECRNGRPILGWPGFVTVSALVAEVERLRANAEARERFLRREGDLLRAVERERDELRARLAVSEKDNAEQEEAAQHLDQVEAVLDGFPVATPCPTAQRVAELRAQRALDNDALARAWDEGRDMERAATVAWLRNDPPLSMYDLTPLEVADTIERGEHREEKKP
jgi:hypothetical protein